MHQMQANSVINVKFAKMSRRNSKETLHWLMYWSRICYLKTLRFFFFFGLLLLYQELQSNRYSPTSVLSSALPILPYRILCEYNECLEQQGSSVNKTAHALQEPKMTLLEKWVNLALSFLTLFFQRQCSCSPCTGKFPTCSVYSD